MTPAPSGLGVDPALQELVDLATSLEPPAPPTPWPAEGQAYDDWLAEVRVVRDAHIEFGRVQREKLGDAPLPPAAEIADVRDVAIPVDVGASIRVRVYSPLGDGPHPALVLFHGGGFWIGGEDSGMDEGDAGCRLMSSQLGAVVVNVDYRQAPEHKFPGPLEDCFAGLSWVVDHAAELSVDVDRVVISGASAGGNLASGVARLARDRGGPALRGQVLLVPTTDATRSLSRHCAAGEHFEIKVSDLAAIWDLYLPRDADTKDPLVSPLLADDLAGLPPTHIVVAEFDPLHDEGVAYAERLHDAGVPTTLTDLSMTHSLATPEVAVTYLTDLLDAVRRLWTKSRAG